MNTQNTDDKGQNNPFLTFEVPRNKRKKAVMDFIKAFSNQEVTVKKKVVRKPRGKYKSPEADLRNDVIKKLRKMGCSVFRVENSIMGKNNTGLADLWVFYAKNNIGGWMELKAGKNDLQDNQKAFMNMSHECGINYWVVRSVDEAIQCITKEKS